MTATTTIKLNVRLDGETERKLHELVDHFNTPDASGSAPIGGVTGVTSSHVVRHAIQQLHAIEMQGTVGKRSVARLRAMERAASKGKDAKSR